VFENGRQGPPMPREPSCEGAWRIELDGVKARTYPRGRAPQRDAKRVAE
jgi:hypothetical protein